MSPLTVGNYEKDLRAFEAYFKGLDRELTWETVDSDVIRDWMESMMDKGNAATSVNRRLSALRSLYRFALARGLVSRDPAHSVAGPKKGRRLPHYIPEQQMDRLIDGEGMWGEDFEERLARVIIVVLYETGIRLAELTGLNMGDADPEGRQLKVTGKRNKQRIVPFGDELAEELNAYMAAREAIAPGEPALIVDSKGRRASAAYVRSLVRRSLAKVTTSKKRSPHVLRHSYATAMLNNGAGIESVRKLLGHESIKTTEIYTHTTLEQLKKTYEQAHPRA